MSGEIMATQFPLNQKIFPAIIFFFIFAAISILISINIGYFYLNSILIAIASFIISYFIYKKFYNSNKFSPIIPNSVLLFALLMFALLAYPLLLLHPFYAGSSDAVQTVILRILDDKIPLTFAPISDLSLTYQIGIQLFVKLFDDLLPIMPDYLYLWFFGVLFGALQIILLYALSTKFFKSHFVGLLAIALFFGTKSIYRDSLVGSYGMLLALNFILLTVLAVLYHSHLKYVFFPAIFAAHPAAGIITGLAFLSVLVFFKPEFFRSCAKLLISLLLVIPVFAINISTLFFGMLSSPELQEAERTLSELFEILFSLPFWLGVLPSIIFFIALLLFFKQYHQNFKHKLIFLSAAILSVLAFIVTTFLGVPHTGRFFQLANLGAVIFSAAVIDEINFQTFFTQFSKPFKNLAALLKKNSTHIPKISKPSKKLIPTPISKFKNYLLIIILFLGVILILNSSELNHFRDARKFSSDEYEFASAFREFDPSLKRAAIFSYGQGKIAEYSNKISYNTRSGWFLPVFPEGVKKDAAYYYEIEKNAKFQEIINSNCLQCLKDLDVDYIIVNEAFAKASMPASPDLQLVFTHKHFKVYKKA